MTRPSMLELVDELEEAGYLERRPDERDGRAKLISALTRDGRRVVAQALRTVRDIERIYAEEVGAARFDEACLTLPATGSRGIDRCGAEGVIPS